MKFNLTDSVNISGRNTRYVILNEVKQNLLRSIINKNLLSSRNVRGGVKGIPAPYTIRNLRAGGINIPTAPKFFRPNESSIMGLGRRVRRMVVGPKTTEQLSKQYGEIPEPGSQPNIGRMVAKIATRGLLQLASSGINVPSAKGNVNTDVIRRMTLLGIAGAAGKVISNVNTLLGPKSKESETSEKPTVDLPKEPSPGPKSPVVPTRNREAELAAVRYELAKAKADVARRGERLIDLMRPENRVAFVGRYQMAQKNVQNILARMRQLEAEGSGTYPLAP